MKKAFENARRFVYRHARPLDLALWQFHFEGGSAEQVLDRLSVYQNEDGGFGYELEPDFWNPHSTPLATWAAAETLREIGWTDASHPMVRGILRYLDSGADFDAEHHQWLNVVPGNNEHPSAIWWRWTDKGSEFKYNPTAALAGFGLRFAKPQSALYEKCVRMAQEAVRWLENEAPFGEQHITTCFIALYEHCLAIHADFLDMESFRDVLVRQVNHVICREPEKWFAEYMPKPSEFIKSRGSLFLPGNEKLVEQECALLLQVQDADGGYPVTWKWWTEYDREFAISANWWRVKFAIENMRFLRAFTGAV